MQDPTTPVVSGGEPAPRAAVRASVGFIHDRTPPKEWVEQLLDVSPPSEVTGQLVLCWEPGDPWTPGQRWMLYELISTDLIDRDLVAELRGPNPRATGHMCTSESVEGQFACLCPVKLEGWRQASGDPSGITLTQWKLYRETGKFGRPFWVIQGARGGHKVFLSSEEQRFLLMAEKSVHVPAIGDLPYADFDNRVLAHVVRFNRLKRLTMTVREYRKRMGPEYQQHRAEVERELRRQLVAWLDEQMAPEHDLFVKAARDGEMDGVARTDIDWERADESIAHYVQTGQLLHPSQFTPSAA